MRDSLAYRSHAKINLYLDIFDRRSDGFHNIETIFQTVSLCDTLTVSESDALSLDCDDPEAGLGDDNLVHRAARLLQEETGCTRGALLALHKEIPVAAGLAGGSGDAAATLIALNEWWGLRLNREKLIDLGFELGSDVPYCLVGGTMAGRGRGELLSALAPLPETWFVLLHPNIRVSTAEVYNHPRLKKNEPPAGEWSTAFERAASALSAGVAGALYNGMEPVVFEMHPELGELKARLTQAGCAGALMSGSGPTLYGACAAEREAERIARKFPDVRHSVARSVGQGVVRAV